MKSGPGKISTELFRKRYLIFLLCVPALFSVAGAEVDDMSKGTDANTKELKKALFAGGCFWCMEHPYDELPGVISTTPGYTGGHKENPTYKEVSAGTTGHTEAVEVLYDPSRVSYSQLLDVFWRNIDPTAKDRQFVDVGTQYRAAIFYHTDQEKRLAEKSKEELEKSGRFDKPIVTEILPASTFYPAEEYHQDYYKKNPVGYKFYRYGSGRDQFLKKVWSKDREK
jgi:methionine-S-sulfoxide reductase